jgi:hypothetical protein
VSFPLAEAKLVDGSRELRLLPFAGFGTLDVDLGYPESRAVSNYRPGRSGSDDETLLHGARPVTVSAQVFEHNGKQLGGWLDELAWFLNPGRRPFLEFRRAGQTVRRLRLRADSRSDPIRAGIGSRIEVSASWVAPSGREESAQLSTLTANPEEGEEGREYPLTFNRVYPESSGLGTIQVVNQGNADADPVIRIFGPCTDPRVINETSGDEIAFDGITVVAGDWLEVDASEATVLLNGDPAQSRFQFVDFPSSRFWTLQPGTNAVRFAPASSSGASVCEVRWRSSWL